MHTDPHLDASYYLDDFNYAVVRRRSFTVLYDETSSPTWFDIYLRKGRTINFRPVDVNGDVGVIFYFDQIRVPQPISYLEDIEVIA